jgi:hypothetical protein
MVNNLLVSIVDVVDLKVEVLVELLVIVEEVVKHEAGIF